MLESRFESFNAHHFNIVTLILRNSIYRKGVLKI